MFSREDSDVCKLRWLFGVYISCYFRFAVGIFVDQEMLTHKNTNVEMSKESQKICILTVFQGITSLKCVVVYQYSKFSPSSAVVCLPVQNRPKKSSFAPSAFEILALC